MGRGLGWGTHRGPCQPLPSCDSVMRAERLPCVPPAPGLGWQQRGPLSRRGHSDFSPSRIGCCRLCCKFLPCRCLLGSNFFFHHVRAKQEHFSEKQEGNHVSRQWRVHAWSGFGTRPMWALPKGKHRAARCRAVPPASPLARVLRRTQWAQLDGSNWSVWRAALGQGSGGRCPRAARGHADRCGRQREQKPVPLAWPWDWFASLGAQRC